VAIGLQEDGEPWELRVLGTHLLIAGATGSGKGPVLWSLLRGLAPAIREAGWRCGRSTRRPGWDSRPVGRCSLRRPRVAAINIDNFRSREWMPALQAAGVEHRRIYDMRHTFATWSLATGMSIFTLARRMGTSVQMIDRTYGHLAQDAEDQDRDLLDAYDAASIGRGHDVGRADGAGEGADENAA
jgi:integrase